MLEQTVLEMRAEEASHDYVTDPQYKELADKICEVDEQIKKLVPKSRQDELYKLTIESESAYAMQGDMESRQAYRQGFMDGLEIAKLLLQVK